MSRASGAERPARGRAVHELLGRRAARRPEAPAAELGGRRLSFGELDAGANRLARHLRRLGAGPEVPVGIYLERSLEALVAMLAVWKAGGAYVPLDPGHPAERLGFLARDAGLPLVITREGLATAAAGWDVRPRLVCLEADRAAIERESAAAPAVRVVPESLAYVIYTSGSTGQPKGTLVPHGELARHFLSVARHHRFRPADRVLQFYGLSFDVSLEQSLPPLLAGACIVLRGPEVWSAAELPDRIEQLGLTVASLPPAYFREAAGEHAGRAERRPGDRLRLAISGGERMDVEAVALWQQGPWREVRLLNGYGPTEATVTATFFDIPPGWAAAGARERVPIGRLLPGRTACTLDAGGEALPVGRAGELALGGRGLARGYLGHPALTAERFVPDPLAPLPGARLYRTGDLGRVAPDGLLEHLGRVDDQVKIRGYRVEPGEVEAALRLHPALRQAAVAVREGRSGDRRLVAYVVPAEGAAGTDPTPALRAFLAERLPDYMMPASFVVLAALPLTPGGKVDRRALPAPGPRRPELGVPYQPPRGPLEEAIAALWAELFGLDRVGAADPFVELGGHSLLTLQLAARLRDAFGIELAPNPFAVPTVAELARAVAARGGDRAAGAPAIRPVPRSGPLPTSFSQERAWFVHRLEPASRAYQTQFILRLVGELRLPALAGAITAIVRRHEIYRTTFPTVDGRPVQHVYDAVAVALPVVDLSPLPRERCAAEAVRLVEDGLQVPFDLYALPLIRFTLLRLAPREHHLAVVEHHVVHDGWSTNVLTSELVELYGAAVAGRPSPLPPLPIQFGDFAAWQRRWLDSDEAASQLDYWTRALAGLRRLELPADRPRPPAPSFRGALVKLELPGPPCEELRALGRRRGATFFAGMMAVFSTLLGRWAGEEDVAVGSGVADRRFRETERLIGMMVNNVVLRCDLAGDPTFAELLGRVMRVVAAAYENQDLPFDKVVEALKPRRDGFHNPLFQTMLSFHDSALPELETPGLETSVDGFFNNGSAKFDLNVIMIPRADQARTWSAGHRSDRVTVGWEYSSDLFDAPTIDRMIGHFRTLLAAAVADSDRRVSELPLLTPAEERQLLGWAATERVDASSTLDEAFFEQARQRPDAVAVVADGAHLSYGALSGSALAMAVRLRSLGIGPEDLVALCLERSPALVTAILGVLAAGGAYVPLDPAHPRERLEATLRDAAPRALVTEGELRARLDVFGGAVLGLDELASATAPDGHVATAQRCAGGAERLAYVIYTSGSTGTPKGSW